MTATILLVEDDGALRARLELELGDRGFEVVAVSSAENALIELAARSFDLLLTDVRLGTLSGVELVEQLSRDGAGPPTIVVSGAATLTETVRALRLGVVDFLEKPFSRERLIRSVESALELVDLRRRVRTLEGEGSTGRILGESPQIEELRQQIERIAATEATVLIQGESGTGKELVAEALHGKSPRRGGPLLRINCAALPENLIEDELFGHASGAFTDAKTSRPGLFEAADGGTLFLDEIGDMAVALQSRLLRVLEDGRVRRLGENRDRRVDVRVVAASHRDLESSEAFRHDLYYRLAQLQLTVPPLRERPGDVRLLLQHFLDLADDRHRRRRQRVDAESLALLGRHSWPGNVRELRNLCERLAVLAGPEITATDLPSSIATGSAGLEESDSSSFLTLSPGMQIVGLGEFRRRCERDYIEEVLRRTGWNVTRAAELLDLQRSHLHARIRDLGLRRPTRPED